MLIQPDDQNINKKIVFLFISFIAAFWASVQLSSEESPSFITIVLLFLGGGVLFVLSVPRPVSWFELPLKESVFRWQYWITGISVVFSLISFAIFWFKRNTPEQFSGLPLFLWLGCLIVFCIGLADFDKSNPQPKKNVNLIEILMLSLLVLGSFFIRTYQIHDFPNGCQSDECNNGMDALDWMHGQAYRPYAETNEGQATLFTYLLAFSLNFFGEGVMQMRMVSAVIGTLTVVAFYYLAKDWLDWKFALTTAALFSVSRWHLTFSRVVYELILTPLAEILVTFFLLRALKNGRRSDWALAGISLAFGMNTYTGFRVFPILIVLFLIYWIFTHRERLLRDVQGVFNLFLGAWIGMIPLSVYILQNWKIFMGRTSHISILNDIRNAGGSLQPLWTNIELTLGAFHWRGDWAAINNLPSAPHLDRLIGVLVIFGLVYALRYFKHPLHFFYLSWVIAGLSLAIFSTVNEAPTARRTIGLLPVIFLISGTALQVTFATLRTDLPLFPANKLKKTFRFSFITEGLILCLLVIAAAVINVNSFFNVQAKHVSVWHAYSSTEAAIGEYMRDLPPDDLVYLDAAFNFHSAIVFISHNRPYIVLNLAEHLPLLETPNPARNIVYILPIYNGQLESIMKQLYPGGNWVVHKDPFGETMFYSFKVSPSALSQANSVSAEYFPDGDLGTAVVTRDDPQIDFQWNSRDALPLPDPFSVLWGGSIYFPDGYDDYRFAINTDGAVELLIDEKSILKTQAGDVQLTSTLPAPFVGGFHTFQLTYHSGVAPREVTLLWKRPNLDFVVIPNSVFFKTALARNGLTGYYYPNGDLSGAPSLIQHDLFILPNSPLPEPFSNIWKGKIEIPESGDYTFGTYADDGSYVYIDGQLIVDNGGSHGSEVKQGNVTLEQGFHDLEIHYWQFGGSRELQFWWIPPGKPNENVPLIYLFPE